MSSKVENLRYEALITISTLPLPFRTIDGVQYVELEVADHLRDIAKAALAGKRLE